MIFLVNIPFSRQGVVLYFWAQAQQIFSNMWSLQDSHSKHDFTECIKQALHTLFVFLKKSPHMVVIDQRWSQDVIHIKTKRKWTTEKIFSNRTDRTAWIWIKISGFTKVVFVKALWYTLLQKHYILFHVPHNFNQ